MKQHSLFKKEKTEFGGSLLENIRKTARPLSTKAPIFLTIKWDISISGSLLKYREVIDGELRKWTKKFQVEIYDYSISRNHMHLCILATTMEGYKNFLRTFNGRMAKLIKVKWLQRPHTELVSWGRHLQNVLSYIRKNHEEAIGERPYFKRL